MDSVQVRIRFEYELVVKVKSIRRMQEETIFIFPDEYQNQEHHKELFSLSMIKNACKSLTKIGQYRNLTVTLTSNIAPIYFDDDFNCRFKDIYLEEEMEISQPNSINQTTTGVEEKDTQGELLNIIEKLSAKLEPKKPKEVNLAQIHTLFVLEKFRGKENAREWIEIFEKECSRQRIYADQTKIQILRLFMEENSTEWYTSTLCKLTLQGTWKDWRDSFLQTYGDKSWRTVHYAYTFRYINGPLIDYALKKERLLLETESTMTAVSRINHIVVGLPFHIQDRLDKEEITTTERLMNQLRRYTQAYPKTNKAEMKSIATISTAYKSFESNKSSGNKSLKSSDRKPCSICESLGYTGRYHPMEWCRNKGRSTNKNNVNLTEADEVAVNLHKESKNEFAHH